MAEIESWIVDCRPSLEAAIRPDAVWVNRSAAFDEALEELGPTLNREQVWDLLRQFFKDPTTYLTLGAPSKEATSESEAATEDGQPTARAGATPKDLVKVAREWLSTRFGGGVGSDFVKLAEAYNSIAEWCRTADDRAPVEREVFQSELEQALATLNTAKGRPRGTRLLLRELRKNRAITAIDLANLAKKARADADSAHASIGRKGFYPWADTLLRDVEKSCGFPFRGSNGDLIDEFAVMLDHAARKVSALHSWIKRNELRRAEFATRAALINKIPENARSWLDEFCAARTEETGAIEPYLIRRRALPGWTEIVTAWSATNCATEKARISAARALQSELDLKFGDIQLFEALAADDAIPVWRVRDEVDPGILLNYAAAREAEQNQRRFKIPAYRHPDPLLHPVFCDFGKSRWNISFGAHRSPDAEQARHEVELELFDGTNFENVSMLWHSKRLLRDLAFEYQQRDGLSSVSRGDRLGRAAAGAGASDPIRITGVFEEDHWNGRLQVVRADLNAAAVVRDDDRLPPEKREQLLRKRLARVRWVVTFSPRLHPDGPWLRFAADRGIYKEPAKEARKDPHRDENRRRAGQAKLILSRLPGIRVLGVDLGHRYAAACAVWEAVQESEVCRHCSQAGLSPPSEATLYVCVPDGRGKTVYRRTADDMWARLDRQFLIKLQGENEVARKASPAESAAVHAVEEDLGHLPEKPPHRVDELMQYTLRFMRLGLRRHGDNARIVLNLAAFSAASNRSDQLVDALYDWYRLTHSPGWTMPRAASFWAESMMPLLGNTKMPDIELHATFAARRRTEHEIRTALSGIANRLSPADVERFRLWWAASWHAENARWYRILRWLRRWILPRGMQRSRGELRHVGGLSLTRIDNIERLYRLQKAFYTRLVPAGLRSTAPERFAQRSRLAIERLRENRGKQLTSKIIAAALGLDCMPRHQGDPRCSPCHAIVIENLAGYGMDQERRPAENRRLMSWCARRIEKLLSDGCELCGIYLRPVASAHTSRQDSRTGAPGIRCVDISTDDFLKTAGSWAGQLARAESHPEDCRSEYLLVLRERLQSLSPAELKDIGCVRVPVKGAEIFVPVDPNSPIAHGIQADLNAAANIGLKALLDPDWAGRWWFVRCDSATLLPSKESTHGSAAIDPQTQLHVEEVMKRETDHPVNLWHDVSAIPLSERTWSTYAAYWHGVERRVIEILRSQFDGRFAKATAATPF